MQGMVLFNPFEHGMDTTHAMITAHVRLFAVFNDAQEFYNKLAMKKPKRLFRLVKDKKVEFWQQVEAMP